MNGLFGQQDPSWVAAASLLTLAATLAPWVWIVRRLLAGRPVLPYQPRRPVPWGAVDVALVVVFFLGTLGLAYLWEQALLEKWAEARYGGPLTVKGLGVQHPLVVVLAADPSLLTLALCFISAVVIAPITEEFFFRLLLQGWLEKTERLLRRRIPSLRRLAPGAFSIVITSAVFAAQHYRPPPSPEAVPDPVASFQALVVTAIAATLTVLFALALARIDKGATAADLGFVPRKFWADVRLGLVAALAVVGPIQGLQVLLQTFVMPKKVPADPISIFFFAAALGILYCRTHRIVPGITLHVALNLTSLTLAWFEVGS